MSTDRKKIRNTRGNSRVALKKKTLGLNITSNDLITVDELQKNLSEAQETISEMKGKISDLEREVLKLRTEFVC